MRQPFRKQLPRNLRVYEAGRGRYLIHANYRTPEGRNISGLAALLYSVGALFFIGWVFHIRGNQIASWTIGVIVIIAYYLLKTEYCVRWLSPSLKLRVGPKRMRRGGLFGFGSLVTKGEQWALRVEPDKVETRKYALRKDDHLQACRIVLLKGARQMTRIVLYSVAEEEAELACDQIIAVIHMVCDTAGLGDEPKPTRRLRER